MSGSETQHRWFNNVVEQLRAMEGVACEGLSDGRFALSISSNGKSRKVTLAGPSGGDFRAQKREYARLRKALSDLDIREGQTYAAPKRPRRPMTPEMLAARAKQEETFNAWQALLRTIRRAEEALDVEYEIAQMWDYY